jgi:peptidoglycan L-alanyl-D-glutamate endopeptidase CwlK
VITPEENNRTITTTLKSKHIEGKAIDICPIKKDGPWWNAPESEWLKIAGVMELFGFEWGGRWKGFKDNPHYQIKET